MRGTVNIGCRRAFLAALLAAIFIVCTPNQSRADVVRILDTWQEALQARVDLIQRARHQIDVSCFAIGDDEIALSYLSLLRDAARRGVRVRVLVDALNNRIPPTVQMHLVDEGIQIKEFHPVRLFRPRQNLERLHDKLIIVDAQELLTGGRNEEGRYYGFGEEFNFLDRDVYVRGRVVTDAQRYFEGLWASDHVEQVFSSAMGAVAMHGPQIEAGPLGIPVPKNVIPQSRSQRAAEAGQTLDVVRKQLVEKNVVQLCAYTDWSAGQYHCGAVWFLCNKAGDKGEPGSVSGEVLRLTAAAQRSILIETPYLVLTHTFKKALLEAIGRGVHVRILTNSLATTDNLLAQAGYVQQRAWMDKNGIELWEFAGEECLHSKSFVFDDRVCVIGSFNVDPRSEFRDTQTAVAVDDVRLANWLKISMERNLTRSHRVGQADQAVSQPGVPPQAQVPRPTVDPQRRAIFSLSRLVAPFIRGEL